MDTNQETIKSGTGERETVHKHVVTVVTSVAGCALGALVLGAIFSAAWPGAVVGCALSLMGIGVAYVMIKRG